MTSASLLNNLYIIDGIRTPIGRANKSLRDFSAVGLGAVATQEIVRRNEIQPNLVDEVIFGNTVSAGIGQNLARQIVITSGLPSTVPAYTVNNVCGSGLQAVMLAAQTIGCGQADFIIAGGAESASQCPLILPKKNAEKKDEKDFIDSLVHDGLWCQMTDKHMGELAELIAKKHNITRKEQDQFSFKSHQKACRAQEQNKFSNEITPVKTDAKIVLDKDERPRKNINLDKLASLPSAFMENGTLTAGNSCAPSDGAAAILLASKKFVGKHQIKPKARILGYASIAVEPKMTFTAAIDSTEECLKKCNLSLNDIDLFEIAEAFAVQAIFTKKQLKIPDEKVNIFGGDVALGHPLGVAGIRVLVTLIHALSDQKKKKGLASVCFGSGGSIAIIIESL